MIRPEIIRKRLQKLDEYLAILEKLRLYELGDFVAEPERYGSAERFLQLAIETIADSASHVVAEMSLGTVNSSSDLPRLFRQHNYIDQSLEERWIRMIGFRNILVHDYLEIDRRIVHQILRNQLVDLRLLREVLARFL